MRYIAMKIRGSTIMMALVFSGLSLPMALNASKADLAPVSRDFRNLCQSLNLKCGRSTPAKKARKARASNKSNVETAKQESETAIPVPRSKPAVIANLEKTEASLPSAKVSAPEVQKTETSLPNAKASAPVVEKTRKVDLPKMGRPKAEKKVASLARPQKDISEKLQPEVNPAIPENDCLTSLRRSGVEFDALATTVGDGRCHVDVPVRLHAVHTAEGEIALPDSPILNCQFARQFALWLSDTGAALVSTHLDIKLAKITTGPGYECRGRNGDASAKLSEHATGNAVDITTITTADGRRIHISDAGNAASPSYKVLRGLRTTACGYFTTVLGPGSNAAHAEHFHFDMGMHGKSRNYRICE